MSKRLGSKMRSDLKSWFDDEQARRRTRRVLWISIGLTVALYLIPFGNIIAYPLVLFSTLVHELGHGLAALASGGRFEQLDVYANASGVAQSFGVSDKMHALVAAGGLVGPALLAGIGFIASPRERGARIFMVALALGLAVALVLFVANPFGRAFTGLVVLALGALAFWADAFKCQTAAVFLSVQLSLSVFSRGDYLFTDVAHTAAGELPSDVQLMANALGGPYWLWGLACGAFSVAVLYAGVWFFLRRITPKPASKV